jgi:hypothetical protein
VLGTKSLLSDQRFPLFLRHTLNWSNSPKQPLCRNAASGSSLARERGVASGTNPEAQRAGTCSDGTPFDQSFKIKRPCRAFGARVPLSFSPPSRAGLLHTAASRLNRRSGSLLSTQHSALPYSHSIVLGGFELMSYTTRLTPFTSLMIRRLIASRVS